MRAVNFYGFENLTTIPGSASLSGVGGYTGLNEVQSFANFMRGTRITAIPSDLFDFSPSATTFTDTFSSITTLTTVPTGLFNNVPTATTFASCFFGCTALTSVPATLFNTNINVVNYNEIIESFNLDNEMFLPEPLRWIPIIIIIINKTSKISN